MYTFLLFKSQNNILKFLEKTPIVSYNKDLVKPREALLIMIGEFIDYFKDNIIDHAIEIKNVCMTIFRIDQSNTVRQAIFDPIMKLLHLKHSSIDANTFKINEMTNIFLDQFNLSRISQTLSSKILKILGLFAQYFPATMMDKSKSILQIYIESLIKQFKSKEPQMQVISGSLEGLCSFLVNFSGDFVEDLKNVQMVYNFVLLSITPLKDLARYEIPKSGLKFISKHAFLLRQYLTEDCEKIYGLICSLCKYTNKEVRNIAFKALDSFFDTVSTELCSGERNLESNKSTFSFFIKKFFEFLESDQNLNDISIGVRGFGKFAASMKLFLGPSELKKVLNKLFDLSDRYFYSKSQSVEAVSNDDNLVVTASHLPSFIYSFANILTELETVDEAYILNSLL